VSRLETCLWRGLVLDVARRIDVSRSEVEKRVQSTGEKKEALERYSGTCSVR
jgi:hypothetical protein